MEAQRLCWSCPVRRRCLEETLCAELQVRPNEVFGVAGGYSSTQRRRMLHLIRLGRKQIAAARTVEGVAA